MILQPCNISFRLHRYRVNLLLAERMTVRPTRLKYLLQEVLYDDGRQLDYCRDERR